MREYLFRGKRVDNDEWVEGYYVYDECGQVTEGPKGYILYLNRHPCGWDLIPFEVDPESVGQYTGINNKKGRKIFEGDIINIKYPEITVENCVVTYVGACFYGSTDFDNWELDNYIDIKVIGNVFDNTYSLEG